MSVIQDIGGFFGYGKKKIGHTWHLVERAPIDCQSTTCWFGRTRNLGQARATARLFTVFNEGSIVSVVRDDGLHQGTFENGLRTE